MKTIIVTLLFLLASLGSVNAQKKMDSTHAKTKMTDKKSTTKTTTTTGKITGLKKDGTPDMRLKENKGGKKPVITGPLKKDSTPDMRYKANKAPKKK